jgi:hypothetical protein
LMRPVFHEDGRITFYKYKLVPANAPVLKVHESVADFRAFWEPLSA